MKELRIIAGADEAGRGCILGPLVIAGVSVPHEHEHMLRKIGVKDSKLLNPARRERVARGIEKIAKDIIVLEVGPCKIDNYRKQGMNLNRLEAIKFAEIVNYLEPHLAYIDGHETNLPRLRKIMDKMIKDGTELVIEHFADRKYPVVGAASIIAKVERDRKIAKLRREYGEFGSGYTSDPVTIEWLRKWLQENKKFPDCVRKTWITAEVLKGEKEQTRLGSFFKKLPGF